MTGNQRRKPFNATWWVIGLAIGTALAVSMSNWAFLAVGLVLGIALGGIGGGRDGGEVAAMGDGPDAATGDGGGADGGGGGD